MARSLRSSDLEKAELEVGRLSVQVVGVRNINVPPGSYVDRFLSTQQPSPYCRISLGRHANTSGVGVRTTSGYSWNREQMFFPVEVPFSCVLGASGKWDAPRASCTIIINPSSKSRGLDSSEIGEGHPGPPAEREGGDSCIPSRMACATDAIVANDISNRLTLRAQVFHTEGGGRKAGDTRSTNSSAARPTTTAEQDGTGGTPGDGTEQGEVNAGEAHGNRLLGECSISLTEVVSGRTPHVEEWLPLDSGGDLRLALDYDSVTAVPSPGDPVVLLCLASRLDFFPLPVWDVIGAAPAPTDWRSSPWTLGGTSRWWGGNVKFRLEETGDDYFLVSYPSPEGWRCAVEVHRFLVHRDPTVPRGWSIEDLKDRTAATPAVSALRQSLRRASEQESLVHGVGSIAREASEGTQWTWYRWRNGSLDLIRKDILFVLGLGSSASGEHERQEGGYGEDASPAQATGGGIIEGIVGSPAGSRVGDDIRTAGEDAVSDTPRDRSIGTIPPSQGSSSVLAAQPSLPLCPITRCAMVDPAVAADGYTYERHAIERWFLEHDTSPVTGQRLETKVLFKNWSLVVSSGT